MQHLDYWRTGKGDGALKQLQFYWFVGQGETRRWVLIIIKLNPIDQAIYLSQQIPNSRYGAGLTKYKVLVPISCCYANPAQVIVWEHRWVYQLKNDSLYGGGGCWLWRWCCLRKKQPSHTFFIDRDSCVEKGRSPVIKLRYSLPPPEKDHKERVMNWSRWICTGGFLYIHIVA